MKDTAFVAARGFGLAVALMLGACGGGNANVGGDGTGTPVPDAGPSTTPKPGQCRPVTEVCDNLDNDCDGLTDEGFDTDGDGVTSCSGDCNDNNASVYPAAAEQKNGTDDNCDGKADNNIPGEDFDKDGTAFPEDCNDDEKLVSPLAVEVSGDGTDNDCNGKVDEPVDCEATGNSPANAIGICDAQIVPGSIAGGTLAPGSLPTGTVAQPPNTAPITLADGGTFIVQKGTGHAGTAESISVKSQFGNEWKPQSGSKLLVLSTGLAADNSDAPGKTYKPQPGKPGGRTLQQPFGGTITCNNGVRLGYVNDPSELRLQLRVPANANSLKFKFNFFTAEYPEYQRSVFNDRFVAMLDSKSFRGNISFDSKGQLVSVNNALFDVCAEAGCTQPLSLLANTRFDDPVTCKREKIFGLPAVDECVGIPDDQVHATPKAAGGATGWLSTVAPVTPGEEITLRFLVYDECDGAWDSTVLIDAFEWQGTAVKAPETTPVLQ